MTRRIGTQRCGDGCRRWLCLAGLGLSIASGFCSGCGEKGGPDTTPLHQAARLDDPGSVQTAASSNPGAINATDSDRQTPLIVAARNGAVQSSKALLDAGADVNFKDANGYTPLHWAASLGQLGVAQLLLERKANINTPDLRLETPLMLATPYPDVVEMLIEHNADLNAMDANKWTALYYAVKNNQVESVKLLLARAANPNSRDLQGRTPLLFAAQYGFLDVVKALVEKGADPSVAAGDGHRPLDEARMAKHPDVVDYLQNLNKSLSPKSPTTPATDTSGVTLHS